MPLSCLVLALVGCGSDDAPVESGAGGAAPSPRKTLFQAVDAAYCAAAQACCEADGLGADGELCAVHLASVLDLDDSLTYDPAQNQACVDAAAAYAQGCGVDAARHRAMEVACHRAAHGTRSLGEPCFLARECLPSTEGFVACQQIAIGEPKRCVPHLLPHEGDPCREASAGYADCSLDPSLACWRIEGRCRPRVAVGQPCEDSSGCLDDAYCAGTPALCVARGQAGDPCGGYVEGCVEGLRCHLATKTCVALLPGGASCSLNEECRSTLCYPKARTCAPGTGFDLGTCDPR